MADPMDIDEAEGLAGREDSQDDISSESDDSSSVVSTADSDLLELQADIAKLDASIEAFTAAQKGLEPPASKPRKRGPRGKLGPRKLPKPTPDILLRLSLARTAFDARDYEDAKERLSELILVNPETYEAWTLLSNVFEEMGNRREALQCLITAAHIQPRNVNVWLHTAMYALEDIELLDEGEERSERLEIANMCYSGAIRANPANVDARTGKADVLMMKGFASNALDQYRRALKHRPLNIRTVRNLADCTLDTRDPKKGAEEAKVAYQQIIAHCMNKGTMEAEEGEFEWSDLRIYLEFFTILEQWKDGARELKRISRWLLGRLTETYWDDLVDDDREWDAADDRRLEVPEFVPSRFPDISYGEGLPIDLRAKLYSYRLKSGLAFEATMHLKCLDGEGEDALERFRDWPDCLKEIGNSLLDQGKARGAIPYFKLYRQIANDSEDVAIDSGFLVDQGRCHQMLGDKEAAEECFIAAIEADDENIDGRYELAKMYESEQQKDGREEALVLVNEALNLEALQEQREEEEREREEFNRKIIASRRKPRGQYRKRTREELDERRQAKRSRNQDPNKRRFMPRRFVDDDKKRKADEERSKEIKQMYGKLQSLRPQMAALDDDGKPNEEAINSWKDVAGNLVAEFRSNKDFFPWEKYILYVASNPVGGAAARRSTKLTIMAERLQQTLAPTDGESFLPPQLSRRDYRGIPFSEWLDIFLEYALSLVRDKKRKESYAVCQAARDSVVFATREDTFLIHVAWASCAVYAGDEEACVAIARYFMRDYAPGADSYRLFAAMSRVCQSPVSWYCSGPAQKFILRQIKLLDSIALGGAGGEQNQDTAHTGVVVTSADTEVSEAQRKAKTGKIGLDVCLLTIYGHILFTTTSYTYALSYFARAATLDPENPMINLSYGLAYIHYALKRQATNRQYLLAQGFAFLFKYYDVRLRIAQTSGERQEAHFNIARAYSMLGLAHLAVEYYQKVLEEARKELRAEASPDPVMGREDLAIEAALNIRGLCFVLEDWEGVQAVTEEWLVLE
ncbi:TPR-like protein [Thozetella sp. PMI_491]|nr:TPR-like protein [Thozetella sp. PMI_491]